MHSGDTVISVFLQIPYIANYKKEYVEPELDMYDLWRVWQWDEKWCQLCTRKKSLKKLFLKIQELQFEQLRNQPDEAIKEGTRPLEEKDLERYFYCKFVYKTCTSHKAVLNITSLA